MTEQTPAENDPFAGFDEQTKRKLAKDLAMGHQQLQQKFTMALAGSAQRTDLAQKMINAQIMRQYVMDHTGWFYQLGDVVLKEPSYWLHTQKAADPFSRSTVTRIDDVAGEAVRDETYEQTPKG